jgi:Aminotransferase class-III
MQRSSASEGCSQASARRRSAAPFSSHGRFADELAVPTRVFSTFGGNPVAPQAALAVLGVIEDERLIQNAASVGARLIRALEALRAPEIVEVRGRGLLVGVEVESAEVAELVVNRLREEGILIGRTGRNENVPKRSARGWCSAPSMRTWLSKRSPARSATPRRTSSARPLRAACARVRQTPSRLEQSERRRR